MTAKLAKYASAELERLHRVHSALEEHENMEFNASAAAETMLFITAELLGQEATGEDTTKDWLDNLSDNARKVVENLSTRHHGVGLERVQRIHLDIDSEPMEFTAGTVAQMLQDVADSCDEHEAFVIRGVVNALRATDEHHVLLLHHKKRGKFVSPTEHEQKHNRNRKWLWWVAHLEKSGIKTEAAVADIAAKEGASRATVFQGIREAEAFLESGRSLFPGSPNFDSPRANLPKKRNC